MAEQRSAGNKEKLSCSSRKGQELQTRPKKRSKDSRDVASLKDSAPTATHSRGKTTML